MAYDSIYLVIRSPMYRRQIIDDFHINKAHQTADLSQTGTTANLVTHRCPNQVVNNLVILI